MIALDVIELVRTLAVEPNFTQRWSENQLVQFVNIAQRIVMRATLWPDSRYIFTTVTGAQEYQEPELLQVKRVYIQGQPIPRSDIDTLEGDQIYLYDQTGSGGGPGGLVTPGAPPVLAGGQFTPQWTGQVATTYPVSSSLGYPAPQAAPWFPGRRPVYYFRGGLIGFVPPPAGAYPVVMDVVQQPPTLLQDTDTLLLPSVAQDVLAWKTIELMLFAMREENTGADSRNYAQTQYKDAMIEYKGWVRGYDGRGARGPKPLTSRSFYKLGNNRNLGDLDS